MIIATALSSEVFLAEPTRREMLADPGIAMADQFEVFDRCARAWLAEHRPDHSAGFADLLIARAWASHTAVRGRLEVTASELHQLSELLHGAPATMAVVSLRTKVNATAARMGMDSIETT